MKTLFAFLIVPLLTIMPIDQKKDIVGKWVGEDQNELGAIIFDDEGYAAFEVGGQIMGGKEFYMKGQKGKMTYSINYDTIPVEIDFVLTKIQSGESKTILGIAEFTDDDTMSFNINFNGPRPTSFEEDTIVLRREK
jgi:uncharacterized protein (TIGR03067 family)